ncbi:hypothetical protein EWM64_g2696 [Hericium alpestre]|uniref:Fungal-type protein kinase domain-containing protein n=1 Tax=Hericium alpestre TaxID=135208 RepID=A0A4Z0A3L0_9AGAM|nr:hypothetical protein EWM64_g2696 [Hericium alpestre]
MGATQQKALVEDVAKMVQEELSNNAYVADTDAFLNRVLPVDSTHVASVLRHLNRFSPSWNSVPPSPTKEKNLYQPFVDTAAAVVEACRALRIKLEIDHAYWIARPDDAPRSRDEFAPLIRPDVAMVLGNDDVQSLLDLDNATKVLMDKIVACQSTEEKAKLSKELAEKCSVWWLRVLAPVEMKPKDDLENRKIGVDQLCRYLRQVLREQLDRRFALGLLVCKSKLSVWFCDRSGLLGTATPIDIHTDPRKFVQVIMAFSCLHPSKLGWDQSMMIYRLDTRTRHFSTDRGVTIADYESTIYRTKWAILLPEKDGLATGKWYITQYVLKQAWRMVRSPQEADFRAALTSPAPNVCDIIRSVDIGVKDGRTEVKDETSLVRQGLTLQVFAESTFSVATEAGNKRKASERDETKEEEKNVHVKSTEPEHIYATQSESLYTARVLTRTLMRTLGWPIKFFKDILELITVIRDAVQGHHDLYFDGVIHRDISTGNILICLTDDGRTIGCLIDLDYAKRTAKRINFPVSAVKSADVSIAVSLLGWMHGLQIDDGLATDLLRRFKDGRRVNFYVEHLLDIYPDTPREQVSKVGLRLQYQPNTNSAPPSWHDRQAGSGRRTGTKAFMSCEVLSGDAYTVGAAKKQGLIADSTQSHSAIHDLESFFWVLVYLCLTRKGPGGARREELCTRNPTEKRAQALHVIVYCLFDSDDDRTLTRNKKRLFEKPDDFEDLIMGHFHPYFERLKPLLSAWWKILRLGFYAYDDVMQGTIHQQVLDILNEEVKNISEGYPTHAEEQASDAMEKELARRRLDLEQNMSIARDIHPWEESPARAVSYAGMYDGSAVMDVPTTPTPQGTKKLKTEAEARLHE